MWSTADPSQVPDFVKGSPFKGGPFALETMMARVTGIGGLFFRAADPAALGDWYRVHLGMTQPDVAVWMQEAGPTVFSPFATSSTYFAPDRQWMLNLRVDDLRGLVAQLRAAGIAVETRSDWDGDGSYGTFARIHDPEGTPIELWQPPA